MARPQSLEPDQFESARENSGDESMAMDTNMDDSGETGTTTRTETNHMMQSRDTVYSYNSHHTTTANREWKRSKAKHWE